MPYWRLNGIGLPTLVLMLLLAVSKSFAQSSDYDKAVTQWKSYKDVGNCRSNCRTSALGLLHAYNLMAESGRTGEIDLISGLG